MQHATVRCRGAVQQDWKCRGELGITQILWGFLLIGFAFGGRAGRDGGGCVREGEVAASLGLHVHTGSNAKATALDDHRVLLSIAQKQTGTFSLFILTFLCPHWPCDLSPSALRRAIGMIKLFPLPDDTWPLAGDVESLSNAIVPTYLFFLLLKIPAALM